MAVRVQGAGLLGVGFLFAFPGGVEFCWGDAAAAASPNDAATGGAAPSLTMFGDTSGTEGLTDGLCEVPARQLESGLVCVTMSTCVYLLRLLSTRMSK